MPAFGINSVSHLPVKPVLCGTLVEKSSCLTRLGFLENRFRAPNL